MAILSLILSSLLFSAVAVAQNSSLPIDPGSVALDTRSNWCLSELNTCPLLCGGASQANTCTAENLNFSCLCSNGSSPALELYTNTLPFYVCQEFIAQCIRNAPNDATKQAACKANNHCGTLNASAVPAATTSTSTSSSSSTPTAITNTTSASASPTRTNVATQLGADYGTGILATALLALFGLLF
ncbi:MAG: hypothetical protein M1829_002195 [Trizodia sp. TS-e1964]|nr:MAG: hypothetical protein M1829_002195 [Trizodia sp. TS-e1964]